MRLFYELVSIMEGRRACTVDIRITRESVGKGTTNATQTGREVTDTA